MPLFLDSAGMMKAALLAFAETLGARTVLGVAETVVVELSVVGVVAAEPVAEILRSYNALGNFSMNSSLQRGAGYTDNSVAAGAGDISNSIQLLHRYP